jgi:exodeoxyribonuclease VII small subunit
MYMGKKVDDGFEDKLRELESLIEEIEAGKDGLNSSVEKYAKAQDLAAQLEKILKGAKDSIVSSETEEDIEEEE